MTPRRASVCTCSCRDWSRWQPLENLHLIVYAVLLIVAGLIASRLTRAGRRSQPPGEATTDEAAGTNDHRTLVIERRGSEPAAKVSHGQSEPGGT